MPLAKARNWILTHAWRLAAAFGLGALMPLAFSPWDWKWAAVLAMAGWLLLLRRGPALITGWAFGLGWFGLGAWWLAPTFHQFGPLAWPWAVLAVALVGAALGLYPALLGWAARRLAGGSELRMLALFPLLVVGEEWLRGHLFTGLPWTSLGSLLLDTPAVGWAAVVGADGAALLPALAAASLAALALDWRPGAAGLAVAAVLVAAAPAPWRADGAAHRVALVQADIPQRLKWDAGFLNETMARYARLSARAASRAEVIVWPEAAVPMFLSRAPGWRDWLARRLRAWNRTLLFGGLRLTGGGQAENGIWMFEPGSDAWRFVAKRHLVPFGEYVPDWIPFLHRIVPGIADFRPGRDAGVLSAARSRYGSLVCYEAIFPDEARARARAGASVLVNVVNDAWYGRTPAAWQHLQAARMRAVETGRWLLRAANTGVSAIIAPDGRVKASRPWFSQGLVTGEYRDSRAVTPWMRWGDAPLLLLGLPALALAFWRRR